MCRLSETVFRRKTSTTALRPDEQLRTNRRRGHADSYLYHPPVVAVFLFFRRQTRFLCAMRRQKATWKREKALLLRIRLYLCART